MHLLVLQHAGVEHPGSFRELWFEQGITWTAKELDKGDSIPDELNDYDGLVVMGGPQHVWEVSEYPWLAREKAAIREWVLRSGKYFLGVCLGHQLLAEALGGEVAMMQLPEVGMAVVNLTAEGRDDRVFRNMPTSFKALQWHTAHVTKLPRNSVVLAYNEVCPVQAFRVGRNAYGVQFHIEATADTVAEWCEIPASAQQLEAAMGSNDSNRLAQDVAQHLIDLKRLAKLMNAHIFAA